MARDLVHPRTRRAFKEYCVGAGVLRTITAAFEGEGIDPVAEGAIGYEGGERRSLFARYEAAIDWTDPSDVKRALGAFESMLSWVPLSSSAREPLERHLGRDGYSVDPLGRIRPQATRVAAELPLDELRDAAAIEEHLQRLERSGDADPPLAISSAKALVEATCKHVLEELGEPYDDKSDLPALVRAVQKALKVHPEVIAPTAKGRDTIVRTLSNLSQLVTGLAELRNEYGPDHGRTRTSSGMRPRHAHLAVGAAHTYSRFLLETLADRRAVPR